MTGSVIQPSFNSGEWAPALNARVDLSKYHSGAALLRNFFVDYRGGATTCPGTKYIQQTFGGGNSAVRLIPFQASFTVSYVLEFGNAYIRFYSNGSPIVEQPLTITAATSANPGVLTHNTHGYSNGDWVLLRGMAGGTWSQLNGNYFLISAVTANTFRISDLNGNLINTTGFGTYTPSSGSAARVYTIASPYASTELAPIKYAQNVNTMVLCHPNHPPYQLVLTSAASWAMTPITIGATIAAPTGQSVATTLGGGSVNYAYVITSVDNVGQESAPSAFATLASKLDLRSTAGTNTVSWGGVTGAASYNIYKAEPSYAGAVPAGATFGFVGNVTGTSLIDSNINPDFSQGPPVALNPFSGTGVQSVNVTTAGSYTPGGGGLAVPAVSFTGGGGSGAAATAYMQAISFAIVSGGLSYVVGQVYSAGIQGVLIQCTSVNLIDGAFTGGIIVYAGSISGTMGSNNVNLAGGGASGGTVSLTYSVATVGVTSPGTGYSPAPTVGFSSGAAAATAVLGAPSAGNPTVPGYVQQRLALMGPVSSPQQFNISVTAAPYNFNVHSPIESDDAIQGTLVSGQLNTIKSMIPQPYGLIVLSDKQAWLLNGGTNGTPLNPLTITANSQAYNGAGDLPPIVANDNILYVQSKGSIVRDLVYNYYTQVYTGADISVISSHLFYGYTLLEWAWAEEPFKVVWAVRNDGTLLSLTFLKEQELIAWAHRDTQGTFKSICTVTEAVPVGNVDAIYVVAQRVINGVTVQYIERMVELYYPNGTTDAWQVDAGIQFNGASALSFSGATQLAASVCTGLATDNLGNVTVINPTVSATGTFTLAAPASPATGYTRVTVGLAFTPQLQTLQLDLGEPTVQGKRKKIAGVTVRVKDALGLSIGRSFSTLVAMKDLVVGNVGSQTNTTVTGLVTGDARTIIDPLWDTPGQYCIQQSYPYPASIQGVIPEIIVGDTR